MKRFGFILFVTCLMMHSFCAADGDLIVNGNVGVGIATPQARLDVNGEAKVGNSGMVCDVSSTGAMRYNFERKAMEFCDGTAWTSIGTPPGTVIYYAANTCPSGYIKANGAVVSRTTYSALFAAIGTIFGAGDGATTFKLPDLRGEFIRSWDDGRGADPGRSFASWQDDSFEQHSHTTGGRYMTVDGGGQLCAYGGGGCYNYRNDVAPTGGTENRPRNVALNACIKY